MNILLLGSGGREHAIAWKIKQSTKKVQLYIAPGNAGTAQHGQNVDLNALDFEAVKNFVLEKGINTVFVGPEEPLVKGIVDYFEKFPEIKIIGPNKKAAQLEGSKDFAKQFMAKYKIPTASYKSFTSETFNDGIAFLKTLSSPYVLKADGLAAGKGVVICSSFEQAESELYKMLCEKKFGDASACVVIEEFLKGVELSVFVVTDGESYKLLPHAKDYKKIGEGDTGLNTGGMGAVSPVPFVDNGLMERIKNTIIEPTISGLKSEGIDYIGFLFFGLMNVDGLPYVIEYNARLGDPETEVILPLIDADLVDLFNAINKKRLSEFKLNISNAYATTVMIVSKGYPENYEKNKEIRFNGQAEAQCLFFNAGTCFDEKGVVKTSGGRVLAVTSIGETLNKALDCCYRNIEKISFEGMYFRRDIGKDMLKILEKQNK
ncbi:MAG: phosphoribosylamine--glycine ligase [Bacteroidales bacterium]|nr:phosphoribosylamine--glycine ligase [Bacteroidales bacterium]